MIASKMTVHTAIRAAGDLPAHWVREWLMHVMGLSHTKLYTQDDTVLTEAQLAQFMAGIAQMRQGMPLAYLLGWQEFWKLRFRVSEDTLIPRPDTERLVELVFAWIRHEGSTLLAQNTPTKTPKRLLDLGTGTGCIVLSLAHELTQEQILSHLNPTASPKSNDKQAECEPSAENSAFTWEFVAVDASTAALQIAKDNAARLGINNVIFLASNWFEALPDQQKFDVIVANPPYITEADEHLSALTAEPLTALVAGDDGLTDLRTIIKYAPDYLTSGGLLAVEHGYDQGAAVRRLMQQAGLGSVTTYQDYGGNDRCTLGRRANGA